MIVSSENNEFKIIVNQSRSSLTATVARLPVGYQVEFHLVSDGEIVDSSPRSESDSWAAVTALSPGECIVKCELFSPGGKIFAIESLKFYYGKNLQHLPPRRIRPTAASQPAASFRNQIYFEGRKAFRAPEYTAWLLDIKTNAYRFAELLGIRTPALELEPKPLADLTLEAGTVVKPLTGVMSQGVYLIDDHQILDLPNNRTLESIDELRRSMQLNIDHGQVKEDLWIREKLIRSDHSPTDPARDLKFYSFYGQIHLALETIRTPEVRRCWYDIGNNQVDTGKYSKLLFPGNGIPEEYFNVAELISRSIPAPFARIDLLASPEGPILNEVTPKPGGSNQFSDSVDRQLGEKLNAAEARLRSDLLDGKDFTEFNAIRLFHTRMVKCV